MTESLLLLVPLLVLLVVALFAFAGCLPDLVPIGAPAYNVVIAAEPDLVSYWRLDDRGQGDIMAPDSAPDMPMHGAYKNVAGIKFEQTGALHAVNNPSNKAIELDGVQGHVEVPFHALLNPPMSFSVEAWVKPSGTSPNPQVVVGSYEVDGGGNLVRGFVLEVIPGGTAGPKVRARIGNGTGSTSIEATLVESAQLDGWRHVVMTYGGGETPKTLLLYINAYQGKPAANLSSSPATPLLYSANGSSPLRIGAGQGVPPAPPPAGQFFQGGIDEVALYRGALSGTKVAEHFGNVIAA